jgi:aryl-alcohol dehydrogenase-like predicted oxidoreductase
VNYRRLGNTDIELSPIGFGAFKIGRNHGIKYPTSYDLPDMDAVERLLNGVLDLGINHIDTAPAYGLSEERIGVTIAHRRNDYILSSKVGETFIDGKSAYCFDAQAVRLSVESSLKKLRTDRLDMLLIHSPADDVSLQQLTDCVPTMQALKARGDVRLIGLSGKTTEGFELAMSWSDVLMIEYNLSDTQHAHLINKAHDRGLGVLAKKGLGSGHLPPQQSIEFVLSNPAITNLVVGGLNLAHLKDNLHYADIAI